MRVRTSSRNSPQSHPAVINRAEFESALLTVWRQSLVENSRSVTVAGKTFPVRSVTRHKLKEVYFRFEGHKFRGSEQDSDTESDLKTKAHKESKVMEFAERGFHVAVVRSGKVFNLLKMMADRD
jgi:hypothetical protein